MNSVSSRPVFADLVPAALGSLPLSLRDLALKALLHLCDLVFWSPGCGGLRVTECIPHSSGGWKTTTTGRADSVSDRFSVGARTVFSVSSPGEGAGGFLGSLSKGAPP